MVALIWQCVRVVFILWASFREGLSCESRDVQEIAESLGKVADWEGLVSWLNVSTAAIITIRGNCATSSAMTQCCKRELVTTYCNQLGGNLERVKEDIRDVLEKKMGIRSQGGLDEYIDKHTLDYQSLLVGVLVAFISVLLLTAGGLCIGRKWGWKAIWRRVVWCVFPTTGVCRYTNYLRPMYSNFQLVKSDKCRSTCSQVFIELGLAKKLKNKMGRAEVDSTHLALRGHIDQILEEKKGDVIEMDDILKADDTAHLVVVEGAPGIGKSTLAWELCRRWPKLDSLKRFSLVVHYELRKEKDNLATKISDLFPCKDDSDLSYLVAQEVSREFGNDVLFVFDGFDELPPDQRKSVNSLVMEVIRGDRLPKATVLLTTRPSAVADLHSAFETAISKCIEIVGFTQTGIDDYVKSVFGKNTANFNTYLTANPVVKELMYNPFNCATVVQDYKDTHELCEPVPYTQTKLYTELTWCLLLRYLSATRHPLAKKPPKTLKDLPQDSVLYQQLVKVGELAFNGLLEDKMIFNEQLPDNCSDLGLLVERRVSLRYTQEKTSYNFFHLTLQEYMSAFYISQPQADKQKRLSEHEQKRQFEHKLHNSVSMDAVWRFVAGLTKMQETRWEECKSDYKVEDDLTKLQNTGWNEFQRVKRRGLKRIKKEEEDEFKLKDSARKCVVEKERYKYQVEEDKYEYELENNVVTVGPFLLQCLYEAQDVQSCKTVFGQHRVEFLQGFVHGDGLHALGYCISACDNKWKIHMQHMPQDGLETLTHGIKCDDESIEELNLQECNIDQRGFENLAGCIPRLRSLKSLNISRNPGGDGSLVKLLKALREHGKLLQTLYMQYIAVGMDDLTALADLVESSSSLRELDAGGCDHQSLLSDIEPQLERLRSSSSLERLERLRV